MATNLLRNGAANMLKNCIARQVAVYQNVSTSTKRVYLAIVNY